MTKSSEIVLNKASFISKLVGIGYFSKKKKTTSIIEFIIFLNNLI